MSRVLLIAAVTWLQSAPSSLAQTGPIWHGLAIETAVLPSGDAATIVLPKTEAPGRPWILMPGIYGDEPSTTGWMNPPLIAALEKGWHVVAVPLGNTYGAPSALKKWDEAYRLLTTSRGFSRKPVLVGLSREGLAILRWAALHPDQVAGVYGDRAVCDFKSWPGGKVGVSKGSPRDWESLIRLYGFASEEEALQYRQNPVDLAGQLVASKVPILQVVGEKDEVVPPADNANLLLKRMRAAGGDMRIITVPGAGHHPHSLEDPKPVIDFILRCGEESAVDEKFQRWKASLPPTQQKWERVLEDNLGSFYLPLYKHDKVEGKETAWDFVQDDPKLPRVLLIGDSVSRGYTLPARKVLAGKANVHRAPANCGPTASGVRNIETWLGDGKWDVIHFNFGIHDRDTPIADYTQRLEQIIERMQKTGAKLIWATTTPIPDLPPKQTAASVVERNAAAAAVMKKHGVAIDDLYSAIMPHLVEMQNPKDVHFKSTGYNFLGETVAKAIEGQLANTLRHQAKVDPKTPADQRGHHFGVSVDLYPKPTYDFSAECAAGTGNPCWVRSTH